MAEAQGSPAFIALVQASAGAVGGVFATVVLQPLEVAKTKIQISQLGNASTLGTLRSIALTDGIASLFNGVSAKSLETGLKNFAFFYLYDFINTIAKRRMRLTTPIKLVLGYMSGVGTTLLTMPLELLATRVQAEGTDTLTVLREILDKEGIAGLFRGLYFNILLCINPAIQNTCFDKIKARLLHMQARANPGATPSISSLQGFILGIVAKAVASTITYPLVRLKTMLQAGKAPLEGEPSKPENAACTGFKKLGRTLSNMALTSNQKPAEQSLLGRFMELYRGLGSSLLKSSLQAGVLYMSKDQVSDLMLRIFKITSKMMRRRDGKLKLGAFSGRPLVS